MFANEVADALPVERFRLAAGGVESLHVGLDGGGFGWEPRPAGSALLEHVRTVENRLGRPLGAPGYVSEWCPSLRAWLEAVAAPLHRGLVLVFDYGYGEAEYYHPERDGGTLGCHYRHHFHDDPFVLPTLQDITASVDFSALARAGDAARLEMVGFTTQAWFLIACGLTDRLAEAGAAAEGGPGATARGDARYAAAARAVRTLTMPGEMGERVRVLGLGRALGEDAADSLVGFDERRLDDRL